MSEDTGLQGTVADIIQKNKDNVIFTLQLLDGNTRLKVFCPFFCPLQQHDIVFIAEYKVNEDGVYRALTQPFVTIPESSDAIKEHFVRILRGTKFGVVSADKLHFHLSLLAKNIGKTLTNFIDDISAKYCETLDKRYLELICKGDDDKNIISISQGAKLLSEWHNKRGLRKLYMLGLTKTEITRSGVSLDELHEICITNPYRIASINYEKCEKILKSVRGNVSDKDRICGKVNRFVFDQTFNQGHTCVSEEDLRNKFPYYNSISEQLVKDYFLVVYNNNVYTNKAYTIETEVLDYIKRLLSFNKHVDLQGPRLDGSFYECKTLTEEQKSAISGALRHPISIITGGAGTGKSEVIKEITRNISIREKRYNVAAYTGKATSKLHSVMQNDDATTIDRLILDVRKQTKQISNHIIIDEGSMVTIELFHRLIKTIGETPVKITIVGDCNQLPPIGFGNLMRELIESGQVPVYKLFKNHRIISASEGEKTILENANALIDPTRNKREPVKFKEGNGFFILSGGLPTVGHIINALKIRDCELEDILILSPYRAFLDELNSTVQEIYLEDSFKFEQVTPSGIRVWRIGDRVMMTKNNYSIKVMNGQIGTVVGIDDEGVKTNFNGVIYTFSFDIEKAIDKEDSEADARKDEDEEEPLLSSDLIHSYAISIHKSQGSEADYIILYLENKNTGTFNNNFLNINLLYTAITRTKKTIWIVSDKHTLEKVSMTPMVNKLDGLAERLKM